MCSLVSHVGDSRAEGRTCRADGCGGHRRQCDLGIRHYIQWQLRSRSSGCSKRRALCVPGLLPAWLGVPTLLPSPLSHQLRAPRCGQALIQAEPAPRFLTIPALNRGCIVKLCERAPHFTHHARVGWAGFLPKAQNHASRAVQIIAGVPELRAVEVRVSTAGDE